MHSVKPCQQMGEEGRIVNEEEHAARLLIGDVLLGTDDSTGAEVYLPIKTRTHHLYVIGKSGSGKTSLLRNLIQQDLLAGHGLAVLAPDDEMFRDQLLPSIPEHRLDDIIYVDPEDSERPIPLNPLHLGRGERLHQKVDETRKALLRLAESADSSVAHRMERILRNALHTLIEIPGHTLLDLPRLLRRDDDGDRFRRWAIPQITDEPVRAFWEHDYAGLPKDAHQSVLNRLDALLTPPVRNLLCTPGACLNFREAMDSRKVLLFRLSSTALQGAGNASIVGQLVVAKLKLAAFSREDIPEDDRPFFPLYIDEFQNFCAASLTDYYEMFSRLRKYRAPLHIAHLETGELPDALVRHILGTASTYVLFQTSHFDAKRLTREMTAVVGDALVVLTPAQVVSLPQHMAYSKVDRQIRLLRMHLPPPRNVRDLTSAIVRRSQERHGFVVPGHTASPGRPIDDGGTTDRQPLDEVDPGDPFA